MSQLGALLQLVANMRFPMGATIVTYLHIVAKLEVVHALFFANFYLFQCADHQDIRHIPYLLAILK
jgi:hypothetical protein